MGFLNDLPPVQGCSLDPKQDRQSETLGPHPGSQGRRWPHGLEGPSRAQQTLLRTLISFQGSVYGTHICSASFSLYFLGFS